MKLENLKVIDASTVLAGPSVASFFAELGADVIKIENPSVPDVTRSWKLPVEDPDSQVSAYFSSVNYYKSYEQQDLKNSEDHKRFLGLVKDADIFISNFKKGDDVKFHIEDTFLLEINPKLIIGKINGFGSDSDRVAYDLILQAESGFMSMNGTEDSGPVKMPVALIDVLAAHQLKEGILLALLEKSQTNDFKGRVIEVSLYESALSALVNQASNYLMAGVTAKPIGSLHPNIAPYGELFETKDGALITFAIGSDGHFKRLCTTLERDDLTVNLKFSNNQNRVINRKELEIELQASVRNYFADDLLTKLHAQFVPAGKIKKLDEVLDDPSARKMRICETIKGVKTERISQIAFRWK